MDPNQNSSATGQAPNSAAGQAPNQQPNGQAPNGTSQNSNQNNNTGQNAANTQQPNQNQGSLSVAELESLLATTRQEAAANRIKANQLETQQRQAEDTRLAAEKKWEDLANSRGTTIKDLEAKIAVHEREKLVNTVLKDHKLDFELAPAITGNTKEEMEASAKILAKHVKAPAAPNTEGGQRQGGQQQQNRAGGAGAGGNNNQGGQQQQQNRTYAFQKPGEVPWPV